MKSINETTDSYTFICHSCGIKVVIGKNEDPTSSSGSCKCCGSSSWNLYKDGYKIG